MGGLELAIPGLSAAVQLFKWSLNKIAGTDKAEEINLQLDVLQELADDADPLDAMCMNDLYAKWASIVKNVRLDRGMMTALKMVRTQIDFKTRNCGDKSVKKRFEVIKAKLDDETERTGLWGWRGNYSKEDSQQAPRKRRAKSKVRLPAL